MHIKIILGGTFTTYNGDAAAPDYLLRLDVNGALDTTFNNGGIGISGGSNKLLPIVIY